MIKMQLLFSTTYYVYWLTIINQSFDLFQFTSQGKGQDYRFSTIALIIQMFPGYQPSAYCIVNLIVGVVF